MAEDSIPYTGFMFEGTTYCFRRMPFGIKTAGAAFTRALDAVVSRIHQHRPNLIVYLDDVLIATNSLKEHFQVLDDLFNELYRVGFRLNREKCEFLVPSVHYLGHDITQVTIGMADDIRAAIAAFRTPKTVKQLQSFLGIANWDRKFIPNLAEATRPLEALLRKGVKFHWTNEHDEAMQRVKDAFASANELFLISPHLSFGLETDACESGLGARLYQFDPSNPLEEFTVAYASRATAPAERNYSTTELKALALRWALGKFRVVLEDRKVLVKTYHSALTYLASCATNSRRIAR